MGRRFAFLLGLIIVALGAATVVLVRAERTAFEQRLDQQTVALRDDLTQRLAIDLEEIRGDLLYLADSRSVAVVAGRPGDKAGRAALAQDFLAFSTQKRRYDQIRLLDAEGMEVVRVNFADGDPAAVPDRALQSKAHRYYFTETIKRARGEVYTSPLDLNVEHRRIELPLKPMLRVGTPVFDEAGRKTGAVILNYLGAHALGNFRRRAADHPGKALLLNEDGYYLVGFRPEQEWAFMFEHKKDERFEAGFPAVWESMQAETWGRIEATDGWFQFGRLGQRLDRSDGPDCRECRWLVVLFTPRSLSEATGAALARDLAPFVVAVFLVLAVGVRFVLRNIERREEGESQIRHLNQAIRNERDAFVGGPTVVFKWRNEYGWPVEYVSRNVSDVLGYGVERFTGGELSYSSIIAPGSLQRFSDELFEARQRNLDTFERRPYQVVDSAGREVWVRDFTSVIRDDQGRITHLVGYVNDITDQKEVEKQLEKSRAYVNTVIDTIADPTMVIDAGTHRLLLLNDAAKDLYAKGRQPEAGTTCHALSHRRDEPCTGADDPCPIAEVLADKEPVRVVHRHFDSDGREIYVELIASPILDAHGEVTQIIESHRDITERVVLEKELLRSNEELQQFAYVASHDLQEPLRMVTSFLQMLQKRYEGRLDASADEFIGFAVDGAKRMQQLIRDLLDYSRVTSKGDELRATDSRECLDAALANLTMAIDETDGAVGSGDMPAVLADPSQLTRLFQNIVGNAVKYRAPERPPRVQVDAERQGPDWVFSIRDNGIGIEPQHFDRVFMIFQRLHARDAYEGTGIGLAVCKKIVERHGGRLWVDSDPGKGSTFFFSLPGADQSRPNSS